MRKLAIFSAAFAAAAALFVYLLRDARALWIAGACLVLSPLALRLGLRRCCAVFLGVAAGLIWCTGYGQIWLAPAAPYCTGTHTLTVTLWEDPVERATGSRSVVVLPIGNRTYRAVLFAEEGLSDCHAGDRVTGQMELQPSGLEVQDGENLYYRASGVMFCLYSRSELEVEQGAPARSVRWRQWLRDRIHSLYDPDSASLLLALITGDQSELTYAVQNDLSVAGLRHAVAVSGMHVSMLLAMIAFCCGQNPRLTALLGIPVIVLFTAMTGASASACRAAVMQCFVLMAPLVRREPDMPTTLGAAALVLLLQNPWAIASVSFQLSFAAVAGLGLFSAPLQQRLLSGRKTSRFGRFAASAVSASLSATVLTLPLTVWYFGLISLTAILTNLLALWAVTLIFSLGLVSCFLGGVGVILAVPVRWLSVYVLSLSSLIARFPYVAAYLENLPLAIWAVLAYGAAMLLLLHRKLPALPVLGVLTVSLLAAVLWPQAELLRGDPVCRVLDVGQGQAIIWDSDGFTAVIDCGGSDPEQAGEQVARTLHSRGQTHVDALVLTHYDLDHAGGAVQLLHRVRVGAVFLPEVPDDSGLRQQIEQAAIAAGSPVFFVSSWTEVEISRGKLVLYPPVVRENDHNSGICVLASADEYDILITGDLDQFLEMRLISRWGLPQAEVLIAGHHGAANATSTLLLETVRPQIVAISVGEENTYGHPSPETLDRIRSVGAAICRTDLDGTLVIKP